MPEEEVVVFDYTGQENGDYSYTEATETDYGDYDQHEYYQQHQQQQQEHYQEAHPSEVLPQHEQNAMMEQAEHQQVVTEYYEEEHHQIIQEQDYDEYYYGEDIIESEEVPPPYDDDDPNNLLSPSSTSSRKDLHNGKFSEFRLSLAADAAQLGKLTRLNEHIVTAVATEKAKEELKDWSGIKAAHKLDSKSAFIRVCIEAAAMGRLHRGSEKAYTVTNYDESEEDDLNKNLDEDANEVARGMIDEILETMEETEYQLDEILNELEVLQECDPGSISDFMPILDQLKSQVDALTHHLSYQPDNTTTRLDKVIEEQREDISKSWAHHLTLIEDLEKFQDAKNTFDDQNLAVLPTHQEPKFQRPTVFITKGKQRKVIPQQAAKEGLLKMELLASGNEIRIRSTCHCPYCKNPSSFQTQSYKHMRERKQANDTTLKKELLVLARTGKSARKMVLKKSNSMNPLRPAPNFPGMSHGLSWKSPRTQRRNFREAEARRKMIEAQKAQMMADLPTVEESVRTTTAAADESVRVEPPTPGRATTPPPTDDDAQESSEGPLVWVSSRMDRSSRLSENGDENKKHQPPEEEDEAKPKPASSLGAGLMALVSPRTKKRRSGWNNNKSSSENNNNNKSAAERLMDWFSPSTKKKNKVPVPSSSASDTRRSSNTNDSNNKKSSFAIPALPGFDDDDSNGDDKGEPESKVADQPVEETKPVDNSAEPNSEPTKTFGIPTLPSLDDYDDDDDDKESTSPAKKEVHSQEEPTDENNAELTATKDTTSVPGLPSLPSLVSDDEESVWSQEEQLLEPTDDENATELTTNDTTSSVPGLPAVPSLMSDDEEPVLSEQQEEPTDENAAELSASDTVPRMPSIPSLMSDDEKSVLSDDEKGEEDKMLLTDSFEPTSTQPYARDMTHRNSANPELIQEVQIVDLSETFSSEFGVASPLRVSERTTTATPNSAAPFTEENTNSENYLDGDEQNDILLDSPTSQISSQQQDLLASSQQKSDSEAGLSHSISILDDDGDGDNQVAPEQVHKNEYTMPLKGDDSSHIVEIDYTDSSEFSSEFLEVEVPLESKVESSSRNNGPQSDLSASGKLSRSNSFSSNDSSKSRNKTKSDGSVKSSRSSRSKRKSGRKSSSRRKSRSSSLGLRSSSESEDSDIAPPQLTRVKSDGDVKSTRSSRSKRKSYRKSSRHSRSKSVESDASEGSIKSSKSKRKSSHRKSSRHSRSKSIESDASAESDDSVPPPPTLKSVKSEPIKSSSSKSSKRKSHRKSSSRHSRSKSIESEASFEEDLIPPPPPSQEDVLSPLPTSQYRKSGGSVRSKSRKSHRSTSPKLEDSAKSSKSERRLSRHLSLQPQGVTKPERRSPKRSSSIGSVDKSRKSDDSIPPPPPSQNRKSGGSVRSKSRKSHRSTSPKLEDSAKSSKSERKLSRHLSLQPQGVTKPERRSPKRSSSIGSVKSSKSSKSSKPKEGSRRPDRRTTREARKEALLQESLMDGDDSPKSSKSKRKSSKTESRPADQRESWRELDLPRDEDGDGKRRIHRSHSMSAGPTMRSNRPNKVWREALKGDGSDRPKLARSQSVRLDPESPKSTKSHRKSRHHRSSGSVKSSRSKKSLSRSLSMPKQGSTKPERRSPKIRHSRRTNPDVDYLENGQNRFSGSSRRDRTASPPRRSFLAPSPSAGRRKEFNDSDETPRGSRKQMEDEPKANADVVSKYSSTSSPPRRQVRRTQSGRIIPELEEYRTLVKMAIAESASDVSSLMSSQSSLSSHDSEADGVLPPPPPPASPPPSPVPSPPASFDQTEYEI